MRFFMKWKFDHNGKDFTDKVKTITELNLFKEIVHGCNKDTLLWYNNEVVKETLCKKLDVSPATYNKALQGLTESDLIERKTRGTYLINRTYVSYGQQTKEEY